jgi:hypothetical protein
MATADPSEVRPAVAHEPPICAEFDRLEPDEFLKYVRQSREEKK